MGRKGGRIHKDRRVQGDDQGEPGNTFAGFMGNIANKSIGQKCIIFVICVVVGHIHSRHVSFMFESDRHFSYLSTLEREMAFRTEMGLYYSYFKNVIEAPTFLDGVHSLYANNLTEYPDTINTLKRFNLYPEVIIGGLFRIYKQTGEHFNWNIVTCWRTNRGEGIPPVSSCEGLGDPHMFYIAAVWFISAFTTVAIFLLGTELSDSILGGLFAVICFFFNHSECTRVQWTPSLRESFAFPICLLQLFVVTLTLRDDNETPTKSAKKCKTILIGVLTCLFIVIWQFAQFALLTQLCCLYAMVILDFLSLDTFKTILKGIVIGLYSSILLMFGNDMLLTSVFFAAIITVCSVTYLIPEETFKKMPKILAIFLRGIFLPIGVVLVKFLIGKVFGISDDAHIFEILRSKFTDFKTFHTLLYTCAREFDFLGTEMPYKTTWTLLLPSALLATLLVVWTMLKYVVASLLSDSKEKKAEEKVDPCVVYNVLQLICYGFMAVMIMRLKLFFGPQLCVVAALLASEKVMTQVISKRDIQVAFLVVILATSSYQGALNINDQWKIKGEYSNYPQEEMIEWINSTLPKDASLAGPMSLMANLLLSTRRPIINHPHYEDDGLRERTKRVYTIFSRRPAEMVYQEMKDLRADYVVLVSSWCLNGMANGCGMTDLWDIEEPERSGGPQLCPILWHSDHPTPFKRVFANSDYVILKV